MKVQLSTTNTDFQSKYYYKGGTILYETKAGEIKGIGNHLPKAFKKEAHNACKILEGKVFNVLISREETPLNFNVRARSILDKMETPSISVKLQKNNNFGWMYPYTPHTNVNELVDAVYKSIYNMDNVLNPPQNKNINIINSEKQLPSIVKKIINQIKQIFAPKNT
jgi:hypothetical protein